LLNDDMTEKLLLIFKKSLHLHLLY